jgi:hypothetical protein
VDKERDPFTQKSLIMNIIGKSKATKDLYNKAGELGEAIEETKESFKSEPNPVLREQYKKRYRDLKIRQAFLIRMN